MKPISMICFALVVTCFMACCSVGNAQTNSEVEKQQVPQVSNERRAELMVFIGKHHPALRPLLNSLKKTRPDQFQSALRSLDKEVNNLQALEKRSPERYKKSLALWIVKSKIKLVAAQLAIKKNEAAREQVEKDLRLLIVEYHDLRIAHQADDVALTQKRLTRLQNQLKDLKASRRSSVEQQMTTYKRNAQRILAAQKRAADAKSKQAKSAKQPAAKPKEKPDKQDD